MKTAAQPALFEWMEVVEQQETGACASARTLSPSGLSWQWQVAVFALAALVVLARHPDYFLCPQFWGEDGHVYFAQAYNTGWLRSLAAPYAGYLTTFQRLVAALALLAPFHRAPLVMNLTGAAVQALPVPFLLSRRCGGFGPLTTRALFALSLLLLPNSDEVHINITDSQWHLALLACLMVLGQPPRAGIERIFESALLLLAELSGPYCFFLLLVGALFCRLKGRRRPWLLLWLAATSAIQLSVMLFSPPHERARILGASLLRLIALTGGHIYLGAMIGANAAAYLAPLSVLILAFGCGTAILIYTAFKAELEIRFFLLFCLLVLAASLMSPAYSTNYGKPAWPGLSTFANCRYWFYPMLAFVWSLIWCARHAPAAGFRVAALAILTLFPAGIIRDFKYPPLRDEHFPFWAAKFEHAKPGTYWEIPAPPDARWTVQLRKR